MCPKCKDDNPASFDLRPEGRQQSYCRACNKQYQKDYYKAHKAKHNKRRHKNNTRKRKELRAFVDGLKNVPCMDCKKSYPPWVMQFDHLRDKKSDISTMVGRAYSKAKILEEVAKCDIVCANCHADRTHKRSGV